MKRPSTEFIITICIIVISALTVCVSVQTVRMDAARASEYRRGFHDGAKWKEAMSKRYPNPEPRTP